MQETEMLRGPRKVLLNAHEKAPAPPYHLFCLYFSGHGGPHFVLIMYIYCL